MLFGGLGGGGGWGGGGGGGGGGGIVCETESLIKSLEKRVKVYDWGKKYDSEIHSPIANARARDGECLR